MFPAETGRMAPVAWGGTCRPDSERYWHLQVYSYILAGLFLLDILTTHIILLMGGVELNPFMAAVVSDPILHMAIKGAILLMIVPVSIVAERQVRDSGVFFYCLLITMYIFVVVNNIFVLLPKILS